MKRIYFTIACISIFALSSCTKDYTCTCDNGAYTIKNAKKSVAKALCEGEGFDSIDYGGGFVVNSSNTNNCSLK